MFYTEEADEVLGIISTLVYYILVTPVSVAQPVRAQHS